MPNLHVHEIDLEADVGWAFTDSKQKFSPRIGDRWLYQGTAELDPFPAYAHNLTVVQQTAQLVEWVFPPLYDVHLFVSPRECVSRTNAFATCDRAYYCYDKECPEGTGCQNKAHKEPTGLIFLSGKRVPPHPAMSRHLVAHEYGHNVQYMLEYQSDMKDGSGEFITAYAKLRGLPTPIHSGSGGKWHTAAAEIFACDFRILICRTELEYWPHMGVPRPEEVPAIREWWEDRRVAATHGWSTGVESAPTAA